MQYTHNDDASIKNIIETRITTLHNVDLLEFRFKKAEGCVKVLAAFHVDHRLVVVSQEEFPLIFDRRAVLNWMDEIESGIRSARLDAALAWKPEPGVWKSLPGTGMRGNWSADRHHV